MNANELTALILLAVPREFPDTVVWRSNVGRGIAPGIVQKCLTLLRQGNVAQAIAMLRWPPSITFGVPGQADISGILAPSGKRLEIEVKVGRDKMSEQQQKFAAMIRRAGGVYIEARSVEDAILGIADKKLEHEWRDA